MDHSVAFSLCKLMIAYNYYLTENTHIIFIKITSDLRVVWGIIYYGVGSTKDNGLMRSKFSASQRQI